MSGRRGRPHTRARGNRVIPTPAPAPPLAPATLGESSIELLQEMSELMGVVEGMM